MYTLTIHCPGQRPAKLSYQDAETAGYYGWHEFDQYPLELTIAELQKRWGED